MKRRRSAGVQSGSAALGCASPGTAVLCPDTCAHHGSPSLPGPACPRSLPKDQPHMEQVKAFHCPTVVLCSVCSALQGVLAHLLLPACSSVSACFPPASRAVRLSVLQLHPIHRGFCPSCSFPSVWGHLGAATSSVLAWELVGLGCPAALQASDTQAGWLFHCKVTTAGCQGTAAA